MTTLFILHTISGLVTGYVIGGYLRKLAINIYRRWNVQIGDCIYYRSLCCSKVYANVIRVSPDGKKVCVVSFLHGSRMIQWINLGNIYYV